MWNLFILCKLKSVAYYFSQLLKYYIGYMLIY